MSRSPSSPQEIAQALGRIYLFRDFDESSVLRVAHATEMLDFEAGQFIAREGDAGDALFIVASGTVRVSKEGGGGGSEQVVLLSPGQHVGEISLLDGAPRSAAVSAAERCEIYRLTWVRLRSILDSDPKLASMFFHALAQVLASRLRATTDDVAFLKHLARSPAR